MKAVSEPKVMSCSIVVRLGFWQVGKETAAIQPKGPVGVTSSDFDTGTLVVTSGWRTTCNFVRRGIAMERPVKANLPGLEVGYQCSLLRDKRLVCSGVSVCTSGRYQRMLGERTAEKVCLRRSSRSRRRKKTGSKGFLKQMRTPFESETRISAG